MSESETPVLLRTAPERARAEDWALALSADGLSPRVWRSGFGFALGVPASQASRAADVLAMYERENRRPPEGPLEPPWNAFNLEGIAVAAATLTFFLLTGPGGRLDAWLAAGTADAGRILGGEPWRAVTALTLHVDFPHAISNAFFVALFLPPLLRVLGGGVGALAFLVAGISGNLVSAIFYGAHHRSVGLSTAIFGAVGILSALAVGRRLRRASKEGAGSGRGNRGRAWVPLGAGLALLAMLGVGPRTDLAAHLFGLLSGFVVGGLLAVASSRPAGPSAQRLSGALALALLLSAWLLARGQA